MGRPGSSQGNDRAGPSSPDTRVHRSGASSGVLTPSTLDLSPGWNNHYITLRKFIHLNLQKKKCEMLTAPCSHLFPIWGSSGGKGQGESNFSMPLLSRNIDFQTQ